MKNESAKGVRENYAESRSRELVGRFEWVVFLASAREDEHVGKRSTMNNTFRSSPKNVRGRELERPLDIKKTLSSTETIGRPFY